MNTIYKSLTLDEQVALWEVARRTPYSIRYLPELERYLVPHPIGDVLQAKALVLAVGHVDPVIGECMGTARGKSTAYWLLSLEGLKRYHIVRRALEQGKTPAAFYGWRSPTDHRLVVRPRVGMQPYLRSQD